MARQARVAAAHLDPLLTKKCAEKIHMVNVDVDWMDPTFTKRLPIIPNDMTSNQLWVNEQMSHPDNVELFKASVKEYKDQGSRVVGDLYSGYE
jgi:hypothetical protein